MSHFSLLPEDVLINILMRLPVKCGFRSRSVCKNWNFVLRSPHFSSLYNNHQLCKQERLANDGVSSFIVLEYVENDSFAERFQCGAENDLYMPYFTDDRGWFDPHLSDYRVHFDGEYNSYDPAHVLLSFVTLKKINNELITIVDRVEKLGILFTSINDRVAARHTRFSNVYDGIICLENEIGVILYNPYTRESQRLPFQPCTHKSYYHIVLGLWFESNQHANKKHYKVFCLLVIRDLYVIEKYDSVESSWTKIKTMSNEWECLLRGNYLLFNGILHLYIDDHSDSLITLDVRSEMFGVLPLPSEISKSNIERYHHSRERFVGKNVNIESCYVPHLFVLGTSLAMFAQLDYSVPSSIDIWIMTEYGIKESWTKQYTIHEEDITLGDFYGAPSNIVFNEFYRERFPNSSPPYLFKLWWRLFLTWTCIEEDEMILETRNRNSVQLHYFVDSRSKLVSFNIFLNKVREIGLCLTGDLLSVVPCIETMLSLH